jgi:hypothetical protein
MEQQSNSELQNVDAQRSAVSSTEGLSSEAAKRCPECGDADASPEFRRTCNTCNNPNAFDGVKWGKARGIKRASEDNTRMTYEQKNT